MVDKRPNMAAMWDERYSRTEPVYGDEPNAYLREQAQKRLKAGAKVLVPGDGYGRNGLWLAKQGCELTTIDVSPVGVERARNDAKKAGLALQILLGDVNTWDWPKSEFDAIVSIYLHLPPEQRSGVHRQMFEALRPGGIVILEAFTPAQLQFSSGGPKQVELLYNAEILRQDFAAAEVLELAELEVELHEGKMHLGEGAVVRAVLRKK